MRNPTGAGLAKSWKAAGGYNRPERSVPLWSSFSQGAGRRGRGGGGGGGVLPVPGSLSHICRAEKATIGAIQHCIKRQSVCLSILAPPPSLPLPSTHPPTPTFELPPHLPPPRTVTHLLCLSTYPPPPAPVLLSPCGVGGGWVDRRLCKQAVYWPESPRLVFLGQLIAGPVSEIGHNGTLLLLGKIRNCSPMAGPARSWAGTNDLRGWRVDGGAGGRGEGGGVDVVDAVSDVYLVYLRWVYTSNQGIRVQAWAVLLPWPAQNLFLSCRLIPWEERECVCVCVWGGGGGWGGWRHFPVHTHSHTHTHTQNTRARTHTHVHASRPLPPPPLSHTDKQF